jgi:Protein of unknown function (DUF3341)
MADGRLHAVFVRSADAKAALERLGEDGVAPENVEVRSSVPLEHDVIAVGSKLRSRIPWTSIVGGALGGTAFFLMVKLTSEAYPLPTGGMPIVPGPTSGVITFEGTAIGAVLMTVATVLIECGLPGWGKKPGPLDHHLALDHVLVTVKCDEGASTAWAAQAIETARE